MQYSFLNDVGLFIQITFWIFISTAIIQLIYYWAVFSRLAFYKPSSKEAINKPAVSVVIAARNEYHNLLKNLEPILNQEYPDFEVIVVNHASTDETKYYLEEMKGRYANLKTVQIDQDLNFFKGKKFPLSIGIKSAKNDLILLTDADCMPSSPKWIDSIASSYSDPKTEVVLGYGPYTKEKGFINILIRYDTIMVAMQYLSFALAKLPYMGVGRNLSYTKTLFIKNKGFIAHYRIPSGDDDLFINTVANKKNCSINISSESFMYSDAKKGFKEWYNQKIRHLSTGVEYKNKFKLLLGLYSSSQLLFFISLFILAINMSMIEIVAPLFILRFITQFIVNKKIADKLQEGRLYLISPILEVLYIIIIPFFALIGMTRKNVSWK